MKKLFLVSTAVLGLTVAQAFGQCSINFPVTNTTCSGMCDGSAGALVTGGTSPYTYLWQPTGQTTQTITGLCSGNYTCIVTDANSNTCSGSTTITQPAPIQANTITQSASCQTCCDGSATATPSGGTPGYTYLWTPGNMITQSVSNLCVGNYTICVTDANGCSSCMVVPIIAPVSDINEIQNSSSINIFPNPFSAQTVLQTDNPLHNATLTVDNCFGQTVAQIKNISGQTVVFPRDNLASGLYFVRLTEENRTIAVDKLVIADR